MKSILVPTDFSDNAAKAALFAGEIAKRNGATVYLLHAMEPGENREGELIGFRHILQAIYESINIELITKETGAVESVISVSKEKMIGLIIMGTKGAGKIKGRFVGTVAASVVEKAEIPVLVIPQEYRIEEPDGLLFATSHFETDTTVLGFVTDFASLFSASVHVVHFSDTAKPEKSDLPQTEINFDQYVLLLRETYPSINFIGDIVHGSDFESALQLYHSVNDTDVTVMINYPKDFPEKLFFNSSTKKMVFQSNIPVLVIPHR